MAEPVTTRLLFPSPSSRKSFSWEIRSVTTKSLSPPDSTFSSRRPLPLTSSRAALKSSSWYQKSFVASPMMSSRPNTTSTSSTASAARASMETLLE
ncbi:MAG: hypothetical protein M3P49_11025 [Actinomycetota bacterium]|nr:hypothetical protein [Actinomycetota bacterium]